MLFDSLIFIFLIPDSTEKSDIKIGAEKTSRITDRDRISLFTSALSLRKRQALNETCLHNVTVRFFSSSSLIHPFKTSSYRECFLYCQLFENCEIFVFNSALVRCSLYRKKGLVLSQEHSINNIMGDLECLKCLRTYPEFINASGSGVLIINQLSRMCLAVRQEDLNVTEFKLVWKSCREADLWKITRSRPNNTIRISDANRGLGLSWKQTPSDDISVYVGKNGELYYHDEFFIRRQQSCKFSIQAPLPFLKSRTEPQLYQNVFTHNIDRLVTSLVLVSFLEPYPTLSKCPINQFLMNGGSVKNENNLPFFIEGRLVTIECDKESGVASLNFSSSQKLRCSKSVLPKPCPVNTLNREKKPALGPNIVSDLETGLTITCSVLLGFIFSFLVVSVSCSIWRTNCEEAIADPTNFSSSMDTISVNGVVIEENIIFEESCQ